MIKAPDGIVSIIHIVGGDVVRSEDQLVIENISLIFDQLGFEEEEAAEWLNTTGPRPTNDTGDSAVPNFPIFSKVAWMHIDSVILNRDEIQKLIAECDTAIASSTDQDAVRIFEIISRMSQTALETSGELEFGHP